MPDVADWPGEFGCSRHVPAGASVSGTVLAPPIGGALFAVHPSALWIVSGLAPIAMAAGLLRPVPADRRVARAGARR